MAFSVSQHCTITGNGQGRAGTNILARESVESVPLGCSQITIGPFSPKPAAYGYFIGCPSNPSYVRPLLGGMGAIVRLRKQ